MYLNLGEKYQFSEPDTSNDLQEIKQTLGLTLHFLGVFFKNHGMARALNAMDSNRILIFNLFSPCGQNEKYCEIWPSLFQDWNQLDPQLRKTFVERRRGTYQVNILKHCGNQLLLVFRHNQNKLTSCCCKFNRPLKTAGKRFFLYAVCFSKISVEVSKL